MKTNFKIIVAVCITIFGLHSCSDIYDAINLNEANSRIIGTSQMNFANTIRVGTSITLGDLSSGVESRLWTFPEGVADIVDSDNDVTVTTANVKAIFNVVGVHDVKLHQVFKEDAYDLQQTNKLGKILDTTIVITVLPEIEIDVKAYYVNPDGTDGAALVIANGAENELIAGRLIRYKITTIGEPQKFLWTMEGGDPVTSTVDTKILDVKYKKLGTYGFSINANTPRPAGSATVTFTDFVKVIPSTDPVTLDGAQVVNGKIALNFSREMEPTTLNTSEFSVGLTNKGTTLPSIIKSLSINPAEGNIVLVELNGQTLYNDDKVIISYTKGTLATTDAVAASSFSNIPVSFVGTNLLKTTSTYDSGFENSTSANWGYLFWGSPWDKYTLQISGAKAHSGSKSAYIEMQPNGGMIMGHKDGSGALVKFNLVAGKTYEVGSWSYVVSLGNNPSTSAPDLRFYINPNTDWSVGPNPAFIANFEIGRWVYSSTLIKITITADYNFMIRGDNQNNPSAFKFYLDDIIVTEAKLRP
ncbi:hypothetical protein SAMN05443543_11339 [Flavobacterium flevense]|uniref:Uncharacterized protein n=1 Tax=Flavobacterium flevense TaxID=983 RepID=A0A4Y4AWG2_9FLAO|nr:hypothetical protein [Flavobacterium flevense]GEC72476.1 hypothetical protein FFL01_20150 [Flavobacterium flevense]SHM14166.1 hypothetical protein SAMN05443543_11339 [Flavobacterium flevense]